MLIPLFLKNKRRIPFISGNTHISLKIRGVFRLYDPNRWILPYFEQLVGKSPLISASKASTIYNSRNSPPINSYTCTKINNE
jgi:hypothetical protein